MQGIVENKSFIESQIMLYEQQCLLIQVVCKDIEWYKLEMIRHNVIKGLLKVKTLVQNGQYYMYYDTKELVSLDQYLIKNQLTYQVIVNLMSAYLATYILGKGYLLNEEGFCLAPHAIFLNPFQAECIHFAYIPIKKEKRLQVGSSFRKLLQFLSSKVVLDDEKAVEILHKLEIISELGMEDTCAYISELK